MEAQEYEDELTRCAEELATRLGIKEVPNEVWGYVMKLRLPYDAITQGDDASWQELVGEAKQCLRDRRDGSGTVTAAPPGRDQRGIYKEVPVDLSDSSRERGQALSEVAAALATLHPRVRRFRENHLGGPTKTVSAAEAEEILSSDNHRCLNWRDTEDDSFFPWVELLMPPLHELAFMAEELCKLYGWREGDAERFVLSGHIPTVDPLTVCVHGPDSWRHKANRNYFLKTARITLTVHTWVRAEDVERVFRDVQRQILGGDNRPLGKCTLSAVRFVAQHILEHGQQKPWSRLWKEWNEQSPPERHYKSYRELRQVFVRFIYPSYGVPKVENALPEVPPHMERLRNAVSEWAPDTNETQSEPALTKPSH